MDELDRQTVKFPFGLCQKQQIVKIKPKKIFVAENRLDRRRAENAAVLQLFHRRIEQIVFVGVCVSPFVDALPNRSDQLEFQTNARIMKTADQRNFDHVEMNDVQVEIVQHRLEGVRPKFAQKVFFGVLLFFDEEKRIDQRVFFQMGDEKKEKGFVKIRDEQMQRVVERAARADDDAVGQQIVTPVFETREVQRVDQSIEIFAQNCGEAARPIGSDTRRFGSVVR